MVKKKNTPTPTTQTNNLIGVSSMDIITGYQSIICRKLLPWMVICQVSCVFGIHSPITKIYAGNLLFEPNKLSIYPFVVYCFWYVTLGDLCGLGWVYSDQGPASISDKTPLRRISRSLKASRLVVEIIISLWILTGKRSLDKTFYRTLKRDPWWFQKLVHRRHIKLIPKNSPSYVHNEASGWY